VDEATKAHGEGPIALVCGAPGDILNGREVARLCPVDLSGTQASPFLYLYVVGDDLLSVGGLKGRWGAAVPGQGVGVGALDARSR